MKNFDSPGEDVTITESLMTHPTRSSGLVVSGDPVLVGRLVGVAATSAAATTDKIAVSTRGVYKLAVVGVHNGIQFGETIYISATAVLSDDLTGTPFGVSVDETTITPTGTGTIAIKLFGATPGATGAGS